jgi:Ca-activated chloride channel family protein
MKPGIASVLSFLVLVLLPPLIHAQQKPQSDDDVIRVDTTLVTLPVKVTDRKGKVAHGLRQDQFRIFENGVEQEIAYFEVPESANEVDSIPKPLTVALLLDISDSTEYKLTKIQTAALSFLELLRPNDRVLVVSFDSQVRLLAETADRGVLREAILRVRTGGGTSLYRALEETINERLSRIAGRKAIVLLTDGVDTANKPESFDSSIRAAETSDVMVFPVQYPTYGDFSDNPSREAHGAGSFGALSHVTRNGESVSEAYRRATLYLRLLADKTAGRFQFADSAKKLARSFESIATQLREQYTLGYYPKSKAEERREIEVKVLAPETTVRSRKNYVYRTRRNSPPR